MSRELDAAIAVAHEVTREPKPAPKKAAPKPAKAKAAVPEKVGAPTVKVDKSGHRVRLRNIDHALEGSVTSRDCQEIRFRLEPDRWTEVPDAVYSMLRDKFYKPQEFRTTSWNGDPDNPQREQRTESYQEYIIEFPEESE